MPDYLPLASGVTVVPVNGSEQYLVQTADRALYVSALVAQILTGMLAGLPLADILAQVNARRLLSRPLTLPELSSIMERSIIPLGLGSADGRRAAPADIYFRLPLARIERWPGVLAVTRRAFAPGWLPALFGGAALVSLWYAVMHNVGTALPDLHAPLQYAAVLCGMAAIGLLHELGHASAAAAYGARPGVIGLGLYLIFPVFYADVTHVWSLTPRQRVVVNLGGIYFQLLCNLILIGLARCAGPVGSVCHALVFVNIGVALFNLNPFLKFDGYWVYADLFGLPNLRRASRELALATLRRLCRRPFPPLVPSRALQLYAVGALLFDALVIATIGAFLANTVAQLWSLLHAIGTITPGTDAAARPSGWVLLNTAIVCLFLRRQWQGWTARRRRMRSA
jgi:putative peptide zinc metalloprotease protein